MKKLLSLILLAVLLTFASAVASAEAPVRDSIVLAEMSEWWGLDVTQLDGSAFTQGLIGDPLVTMDNEGNIGPLIASEVVVSEDGKTITLTIPEGMYFASGEQLEPEDVIASLERIQKVSPFASQYSTITSMEEDGRNVILHVDHYSADLYAAMANSFTTVMDKAELEAKTDDELLWDCHPYGAYSYEEYVSGSHVVLKRNPGYVTYNPYVENKGAAYIDEITIRFISEDFTLAQEINAGNVNYAMGVSTACADQITRENAVVENRQAIPNVTYIEFNLTDPVAGDDAVRLAFAHAINREELASLVNNTIDPSYCYVTEKVRNHNADYEAHYRETFPFDIEKAKAILDEAGWVDTDGDGIREKDGQTLNIDFVLGGVEPDQTIAQGLQIQLYEAGIMLNLNIQEDNYHYEVMANGEFQAGFSRFGTADPVLLMQWVLNYFPSFEYVGGEQAFFDAVTAMAVEPDAAKRTEMIYDLEKICNETQLIIPLYTTTTTTVRDEDLANPVFLGNGFVYFNDMK